MTLLERIKERMGQFVVGSPTHTLLSDCAKTIGNVPQILASRTLFEIAAERTHQIDIKGYTAEHDDEHDQGEIAALAAYYATPLDNSTASVAELLKAFPIVTQWAKPKDRRRDLIRAAALIVAEIERLDRAETIHAERSDVGTPKPDIDRLRDAIETFLRAEATYREVLVDDVGNQSAESLGRYAKAVDAMRKAREELNVAMRLGVVDGRG